MSDKRRDDDHDVANPITRAIALGIDRGTFGAINGASIVYDGAVVTDALDSPLSEVYGMPVVAYRGYFVALPWM